MFFRRKNIRPYEKASVIVVALLLISVGRSIMSGRRASRAAEGILVALASEFWRLGCPRIYNEVATRLYCSFGLGLRAKEIASLTIADVANSNYHLLNELSLKRGTPTLSPPTFMWKTILSA